MFYISFKDWRNIFTKLNACVNLTEGWTGISFNGSWEKNTAGGTPTRPDTQAYRNWARNP